MEIAIILMIIAGILASTSLQWVRRAKTATIRIEPESVLPRIPDVVRYDLRSRYISACLSIALLVTALLAAIALLQLTHPSGVVRVVLLIVVFVLVGFLLILVAAPVLAVGLLAVVLLKERFEQRRKARSPNANLINLPVKLYEGDSRMVIVRLAGWSDLVKRDAAKRLLLIDGDGHSSPTGVDIPAGFYPKRLEVELLAPGLNVEGEKRQKHEVLATPMAFQWGISHPNSGNHEIGLVFRSEGVSGQTRELGVITHKVKVVKIDHLTSRQLWVLTSVCGLITGLLAVLEVLHKLGIISFPSESIGVQ